MNNIKTGIRNLWASKSITTINIIGLSLGLSAFTIIMLWVENEYSFNKNVKDRDQIAAIMVHQSFESGEIQTYPATPPPLAKYLQENIKGVSSAATTSWGDQMQFTVGDNTFTEWGLYTSPEFLDVFDVHWVSGQKSNALLNPNTVLISEPLAKKYFPNSDPIGKTILTDQNIHYEVKGVFKANDAKTTIRYDFLMPISDYFSFNPFLASDWSVNNVKTYVKFDPKTDFQKVHNTINTLLHKKSDRQKNCDLFLFHMKDWYLRGEFKNGLQVGGRITYVRLFALVAFAILLLSCINFINLTTASATQRLKEVGVRKSLGADRWTLFRYFLMESCILASISGFFALGMVHFVLPLFNAKFGQNLDIEILHPDRLLMFIFIVILTGILAGIYPAMVLSGMNTVAALKKSIFSGATHTSWVRKALVTGQFAVTILLITGSVIVSKQLDFFHTKDLGLNNENLVWFPNKIPYDKVDVAMQEMEKINGVKSTSLSSMTFQGSNNRGHEVNWPHKKPSNDVFFNFIAGSHDLPLSLGLTILEGRSFSKIIAADTNAVLINETAVRQMNLQNPVGQIIDIRGMKATIIGVLKDFHFESLHNSIGPVIIQCKPDWTWLMYAKLDGGNDAQVLNSLKEIYQKFAPGQIFEYNYQKDQPQWFYRSELQTAVLIKWFSGFAVFLSCLGLLGLTIFTINRKQKEIGIRKVLGAKVQHVLVLLVGQFLILIGFSVILSLLPSVYLTFQWLENFPYNTDVAWSDFVLGPLLVMVMAISTMSILVFKATLVNPVKSIRTE